MVRFGLGGVAVMLAALQWLTVAGVLFILCWKYKAVRTKEMGLFVLGILPLAVAAAGIGGEVGRALGQLIGSQTFSPALSLGGSMASAAMIFYGLTLRFLAASRGVSGMALSSVAESGHRAGSVQCYSAHRRDCCMSKNYSKRTTKKPRHNIRVKALVNAPQGNRKPLLNTQQLHTGSSFPL